MLAAFTHSGSIELGPAPTLFCLFFFLFLFFSFFFWTCLLCRMSWLEAQYLTLQIECRCHTARLQDVRKCATCKCQKQDQGERVQPRLPASARQPSSYGPTRARSLCWPWQRQGGIQEQRTKGVCPDCVLLPRCAHVIQAHQYCAGACCSSMRAGAVVVPDQGKQNACGPMT